MNPDDVMDVYVPGAWKCMKCGFGLSQATIFIGSGEIGCTREQVMKMSGELCPNDGEPMARVTWRDRAEENRKWGESLMEDIICAVHAEHLPGALDAIRRHFDASVAVKGEAFWMDELEFQLGRPLTPTGRNHLRSWLRAFAANERRQVTTVYTRNDMVEVLTALWDMQSTPDCWCDAGDGAPMHSPACAYARDVARKYKALAQ